MSAITPKAPNHANLPPLASRFVDVAAMPWEKSLLHPGVETKTLVVDRDSGLLTMLLRMAPGAKLPDHEHVLVGREIVVTHDLARLDAAPIDCGRRSSASSMQFRCCLSIPR